MCIRDSIHTSADFDYADNLCFSPGAVETGIRALQMGVHIVTDTTMAMAGINKRKLAEYGGSVHCFIQDADVAREAKERGITRSAVSMERAAALPGPLIFAIGNAPTALIRLYDLIRENSFSPALIIGVPVGFVHVVEAKELIMQTEVPYIVARGRKEMCIRDSSTCMYVFQLLKRRGFAAELVPGISAASAGAALAGISLARDQESVAVVPLGRNPEKYRALLDAADNLVLMKAGHCMPWIMEYMKAHGILPEQAVVFADLGLPGEYVGAPEADRDYGYFTTVIVNKKYDRT